MLIILLFIILLNNKNYLSIIILLLFNYIININKYIFNLNSISNYNIIYFIIILLIIT